MPRQSRIVIPGQAMHVIQRGINRQSTFCEEEDYKKYLDTLFEYAGMYECLIHAYVLMNNHIHLLLTPQTENSVSLLMQAVGRKYVRYINTTYQRTGTLWDGRYKSAIIDSEQYLFTCSKYIELNPVRTGIAEDPGEYRWSSYRTNALGEEETCKLTPHPLYESLGNTLNERQHAYYGLFDRHLEKDTLELIRLKTQQCTAIGSNKFQEKIEMMLKRRIRKLSHGGDRKSKQFTNNSSSVMTSKTFTC